MSHFGVTKMSRFGCYITHYLNDLHEKGMLKEKISSDKIVIASIIANIASLLLGFVLYIEF